MALTRGSGNSGLRAACGSVPREPLPPARALLGAALPAADAPFALLHQGRLAWATPGCWIWLGLLGGRFLGELFLHPQAPGKAEDLERATSGGVAPEGLELVPAGEGLLLRPRDLAESLALVRRERRIAAWQLTPAERRELEHLRHGLTSKEAAVRDGVSPETNRQRRRQIFRKADVPNAGALRAALEGLAHPRRR